MLKAFHLAGIIPIAKNPYDYGFIFDDCLIPIEKNYTAIERSIAECLWAGCETIWIVAHRDMQPIIKHCVGESMVDPLSIRPRVVLSQTVLRDIQIYYVPIHPKDRRKRDCLAYSVLYGALSAFMIATRSSRWILPDKYYVSFPWGVFDPEVVRPFRPKISSSKNFSFSYEGKTIQDGLMTSFSFSSDDYKKAIKTFRYLSHNKYFEREEHSKVKFDFSLDKIFKSVIMENVIELDDFFQIDTWEKYRNYMSTDYTLVKPDFIRPKFWHGIGEQDGDDEETNVPG